MKNIYYLGFFFIVFSSISCNNNPTSKGLETIVPFPNESVMLTESWFKQREDLNTIYLKSLDPDRLHHNFRVNAGLPSEAQPLEGWEAPYIGLTGHFTSHYLSAVSLLIERYHDSVITDRLNDMNCCRLQIKS